MKFLSVNSFFVPVGRLLPSRDREGAVRRLRSAPMAVTRSTPESREASRGRSRVRQLPARPELIWLLLAATIVCGAWWLVYSAKIRRAATPVALLNISQIDRAEKLYPVLAVFQSPADREFVAQPHLRRHRRTWGRFAQHRRSRAYPHGSHGHLWEPQTRGTSQSRGTGQDRLPSACFTPAEFAQLKPQIAVRDMAGSGREFLLWAGAILAAFLFTNLVWTFRGFTGPLGFPAPAAVAHRHRFRLMVALRDPLRDTLIFVPFAQGVAGGCIVMLLASFVNWEATTAGYSFVPLLGAIVLSLALIFFGSGPSGSDARVNLGPFQPVEAIKILLVFFLAGYFSKRWPLLRQLREKRFAIPGMELPPLRVCRSRDDRRGCRASCSFTCSSDLGPALVFAACSSPCMRSRATASPLAVFGMLALLGGFLIGLLPGHAQDGS